MDHDGERELGHVRQQIKTYRFAQRVAGLDECHGLHQRREGQFRLDNQRRDRA